MQDLIGRKFERLTVIGVFHRNGVKWLLCECDCTTICEKRQNNVVRGRTKSCGCLNSESTIKRNFKHGAKHDEDAPYNSWLAMRQRCLNPNSTYYRYYGGRGITIDERWSSFAAFREDMGSRPSKEHSLDRIDVNGNYGPQNCRWATAKQQRENQRTQNFGKKLNEERVREIKQMLVQLPYGAQPEIARKFGISPKTVSAIKHGKRWKEVQPWDTHAA